MNRDRDRGGDIYAEEIVSDIIKNEENNESEQCGFFFNLFLNCSLGFFCVSIARVLRDTMKSLSLAYVHELQECMSARPLKHAKNWIF